MRPEMLPFFGIAMTFVVVVGVVLVLWRSYRSVAAGKALVINTGRDTIVSMTGRLVLPIIHRAEEIDLSVHKLVIDRRRKDGVICADSLRADLTVTFFVRIAPTMDDVLRVARSVGCTRASDPRTIEELFAAKFSEAIKTVAKHLEFEQLFTQRETFKDRIIEVIGRDLNGYTLDDAVIDHLEQTPIEYLDPANVLDAMGIEKIRRLANVDARASARPALDAELKEAGLLDVRVAIEVSCDVSPHIDTGCVPDV